MKSSRIELLVCAAVLAVFGLLLLLAPRLYGYFLMEDLPPEWFQFFCLATAVWHWGTAAAARWRGGAWLGAMASTGLCVLCVFVAGEEISWGQRIVGYQTPSYFEARNVQHELTIHNLARQLVEPRRMATVIMVAYGMLLPGLALAVKPIGRRARSLRVPLPGLGAFFCFAAAVWLMSMPFTATDDEVGEVFFSLGLLFAAFDAVGPRPGAAVVRRVVAVCVLSFVASMLCFVRPAHRTQVCNVGHLQAAQAFEGLGRRWEAAREYEALARYWRTDWELWIKVIGMYYEEGDLRKAWDLSAEFIGVNKREWRPFEVMAEIGRMTGTTEETRSLILGVLEDEPYNDYARWALLVLDGKRPFMRGEEVRR